MVKCCKPFHTTRCSVKLRKLNENIIKRLKLVNCQIPLDTSSSICDSCRLHLNKVKPEEPQVDIDEQPHNPVTQPAPSTSRCAMEEIPSVTSITSSSQESLQQEFSRAHNIELFNKGIAGINVSPVSSSKLKQVNYPRRKYLNITDGLKRNIFGIQTEDDLDLLKQKAADFDEIIFLLKEKFATPECSREDKIRILTVLPKSWNNQTIIEQFNTHEYIVNQARRIADVNGVCIGFPQRKDRKRFDPGSKKRGIGVLRQ